MTVHKKSGIQNLIGYCWCFRSMMHRCSHGSLSTPAVTRARERFEISGSEALLRLAVARRLQRPSGLRDALWG